ncbi:MAG: D-alanine aminotransferase [Chlamydiae bacterium]|nr:D-alanine aminotransferase [Chlamydiota bacterium]
MNFINGVYCPTEESTISVQDLGFLRGIGVFEYMRTYQKRPFYLQKRLERLKSSTETLGIPLSYSIAEIEKITHALIEKAPWEELTLRILATGGTSLDGLTPTGGGSLVVLSAPTPAPAEPLRLITYEAARYHPECKTLHYLPALLARQKAKQLGADDALFCTGNGEILEATTANFFAIKEGVLITAEQGILKGITRQILLDKLWEGRIEYRPLHRSEIPTLDEAFITSSIREIVPIISIDGHSLPAQTTTNQLIQAFKKLTSQETC